MISLQQKEDRTFKFDKVNSWPLITTNTMLPLLRLG